MSELRATLTTLREKRRSDDLRLGALTAGQLDLPTTFTWETMMTGGDGKTTGANVRDIFLRRADHLEEHAIQIEGILRGRFGVIQTPAQAIWAANQRARGLLAAALVGLRDADLDLAPPAPDGEWTLRQTLEHILVVERYYAIDTRFALARFRAGEPHGDLPDDELEVERPGATLAQLVAELDAAREDALADLPDLTDAELRAPALWDTIAIDVRLLQLRFGHHERQHVDQVLKWRAACDRPLSEAQRLLGLCWQASAALEGILVGAPDEVLDRDPATGDWPIRRILAHIRSAESYFRRLILRAVEA